jgi:hypothetical protein
VNLNEQRAKKLAPVLQTIWQIFLLFWTKIRLLVNKVALAEYVIFSATSFSNEHIFYRYSKVMRSTLLFTLSNGNEVTGMPL